MSMKHDFLVVHLGENKVIIEDPYSYIMTTSKSSNVMNLFLQIDFDSAWDFGCNAFIQRLLAPSAGHNFTYFKTSGYKDDP